jgi:hypothetical protein
MERAWAEASAAGPRALALDAEAVVAQMRSLACFGTGVDLYLCRAKGFQPPAVAKARKQLVAKKPKAAA